VPGVRQNLAESTSWPPRSRAPKRRSGRSSFLCAQRAGRVRDRSVQTEVIRRRGPWRGLDDVEIATLTWVAWCNSHRLLEPLGYVPPAEFEQAFYGGEAGAAQLAVLT
jgi:transposase InsO family protein